MEDPRGRSLHSLCQPSNLAFVNVLMELQINGTNKCEQTRESSPRHNIRECLASRDTDFHTSFKRPFDSCNTLFAKLTKP